MKRLLFATLVAMILAAVLPAGPARALPPPPPPPEDPSGGITCTSPSAAPYRLPTPFYGRAQDGDYIGIIMNPAEPYQSGTLKIRLDTNEAVTWWKQMDIYDCRGNLRVRDYTQDGRHATPWYTLNATEFRGGTLVLWKAKEFGIHKAIYQMPDPGRLTGGAMEVHWGSEGR